MFDSDCTAWKCQRLLVLFVFIDTVCIKLEPNEVHSV
jgi:hypothetical protein